MRCASVRLRSSQDAPRLVAGVVSGIGGYGNCMGVPTVGRRSEFSPLLQRQHSCQRDVRWRCAKTDKIFLSAAKGAGNPVIYVGSKTGPGWHPRRHHGVSAEFNDAIRKKNARPYRSAIHSRRKLLLEACLELMATDAIIAIQDMGAAGLTSSSAEMASTRCVQRHRTRSRPRAATRSQHDSL